MNSFSGPEARPIGAGRVRRGQMAPWPALAAANGRPVLDPGAKAMRTGRSVGGNSNPPRPGLVPLLALLTLLYFGPFAGAATPPRTRMVVMLYPDNSDGSPGNALADRGIRSTFAAGSPERVEIYNEYLDISRSSDVEHQQLQAEYLRRKYAGRKVDLVIAGL